MDNLDQSHNRAWRRHQEQHPSHRVRDKNPLKYKPEKKWDLVYLRSNRIKRVQKLGSIYPFRQHEFDAKWFD